MLKLDKISEADINKVDDINKQKPMPRRLASEVLFAGGRELLIKHASEIYLLRITSQGKLILTK